jgi:hypothetical protein
LLCSADYLLLTGIMAFVLQNISHYAGQTFNYIAQVYELHNKTPLRQLERSSAAEAFLRRSRLLRID